MNTDGERLHALDALRGFALLCGVVLHAAMSYLPGFTDWPLLDRTPSGILALIFYFIHMFRMTTFFVIAGFFARLLVERRGVRAFVRNRAMRIVVPLVIGWIVFFPLIVLAITWGAGGQLTQPNVASVNGAPAGPLAFPLGHLWFLYLLTLIYAAMVPVRAAVLRIDADGRIRKATDAVMRAAMAGPWAPVVLALPLLTAFLVSPWLLWSGIPTPDQSLIPNAPAAVGFSSAFAVGWLLHRQQGLLKTLERWAPAYLAAAVVLALACLIVLGPKPGAVLSTNFGSTRLYSLLYAAGVWSWTLGLIGAALRFLPGESAVRRYVSDASYWIYLAHVPVVFALQAVMKDVPWHWAVKFPLLLAVALAVLFATYHLFVRFTVIGQVLNGVRHRRQPMAVLANAPLSE